MHEYTISISDPLYEKVQRVAEQTSQSVEEVIQTRLNDAFDESLLALANDEQIELRVLTYLSDDPLWVIAREQMLPALQTQLSELMSKNSLGTITSEEYQHLEALVDRGQRLMLRKAHAMKLLIERGYAITLDNLKPSDE